MQTMPTIAVAGALAAGLALAGCQDMETALDTAPTAAAQTQNSRETPVTNPSADHDTSFQKIEKTDAQWKQELSDLEYRVTREHGTERPGTSPLLKEKRKGTYYAIGGTAPLFTSEQKFESGTGWPSFYDVVDPDHVTLIEDNSLGMTRTEVRCAQTGHHLGHVFNDGPKPTGLRYCINGAALRFEPAEEQ